MIKPLLLAATLAGVVSLSAPAVQADFYLSMSPSGTPMLSNVRHPGQRYSRIFTEPRTAAVAVPASLGPGLPIRDRPYAAMVAQAAVLHGVPEALLHAVIQTESNYQPNARSPKGAGGLMQLMPETARFLGVADVYDPASNIQGGARYLSRLLRQFDNDLQLALAAYNAGPEAVLRSGRAIPPYRETQRYVPDVLGRYRRLAGLPQ